MGRIHQPNDRLFVNPPSPLLEHRCPPLSPPPISPRPFATRSRPSSCCLPVSSRPLGLHPSVGGQPPVVWWLVTERVASLARASILNFLRSAIKVGHLEIVDSRGVHSFGTHKDGRDAVRITVHNDLFYVRVLASADLGLSESYMLCDIDVNDLKGMMNVGPESHLFVWAKVDLSIALARQLRRDDRSGFRVEQA